MIGDKNKMYIKEIKIIFMQAWYILVHFDFYLAFSISFKA